MFVRLPFISSVYWFLLGLKRVIKGTKHTCEIDLTDKCNLSCSHCYFFANKTATFGKQDIELEVWAERLKKLYSQGIRKVLFVGGEPALRLDVLELADSIFPVLHVITNGTLKIPKSFCHTFFVSMDGTEKTNDKIRGRGTFKKIIENYNNDRRVIINMTLLSENYTELEDVVKIAVTNRLGGVACNLYCNESAEGSDYDKFIHAGDHKKIIAEIKRVKKIYPAQLLFTKSIIDWYEHPDHRNSCYWREKVDHYDVDFNRRTCFMPNPDCSRCGCYAGAFSVLADNPIELTTYWLMHLFNLTSRLFRKTVLVLMFFLICLQSFGEEKEITLEDLLASAKSGSVRSQIALGNSYFFGKHGQKDYKLAFQWYKKAVDNGSKTACFNLALCYENGLGVDVDQLKAFNLYKQAAENGIPQAEFNVAICYKTGIYNENHTKEMLSPNLIIAENKLKGLADKDFYPAFRALAEIYLNKEGGEKHEEAFELLKKSAFHKDAQAMNLLADCFNYGWGCKKDNDEKVTWLQRAAEAGSMEACAKLAYCYERGDGVPLDPKRAIRLYSTAATAGLPMAQVKMGEAYAFGNHVRQDVSLAKQWYERAAASGNSRAIFYLGLFAMQGIGEGRDDKKAALLFLKAAKLNDPHAQFNIASFFVNGRGLPEDKAAAFFWYKRSAEQNTPKAQRELAFCYFEGIGTEKNFKEGMKWLKKAVENGDEEAKKFLKDISAGL